VNTIEEYARLLSRVGLLISCCGQVPRNFKEMSMAYGPV